MAQTDIVRHSSKRWNTCSDQHRYACDHQLVDASRREKFLNRDAAVDIRVLEAAGFDLLYNFDRLTGHLLDDSAFHLREIERMTAEHDDWLLAVGPIAKCQHNFVRPAANHEHVYALVELLETVRLLSARIQKIERMVGTRQNTIYADATEPRDLHSAHLPT